MLIKKMYTSTTILKSMITRLDLYNTQQPIIANYFHIIEHLFITCKLKYSVIPALNVVTSFE